MNSSRQYHRNCTIVVSLKWFSLFACLLLSGCSSLQYYSQAISGHLDLISRERPIAEVLQDQGTSSELKGKLKLAQQARRFATQQLSLPDNNSYTTYADLERDSVVWNVVATPAYSIKPKQWCFLVVGCISYRGYFSRQQALDHAKELMAEGLDVQVSGATAYSTLGYFDDPVLNTMLQNDDSSLVGIIFHELAHQVVYIDGDSAFNEAFATAVEQEGLRRWYQQQQDETRFQQYLNSKKLRHGFYTLLKNTRERLDQVYRDTDSEQQKSAAKKVVFTQLQQEYHDWRTLHQFFAYDAWMQRDLNNAHLALIATYHDLVPTFVNLLRSVNDDLPGFYRLVSNIGDLPAEQREQKLSEYHQTKIGKYE